MIKIKYHQIFTFFYATRLFVSTGSAANTNFGGLLSGISVICPVYLILPDFETFWMLALCAWQINLEYGPCVVSMVLLSRYKV